MPVCVRLRSAVAILTTASADGNSLVVLCYRTEPAVKKDTWTDIPLWVTVNAADTLNLHGMPPSYVTKVVAENKKPAKAVREVVREIQQTAKAVSTRDSSSNIISQSF